MKNLLEFLLNRIVSFPEDIRVEESEEMGTFIYTIYANPEDIGKIIGKNGTVINAIRTIAKVRAIKEHLRIRITLAD